MQFISSVNNHVDSKGRWDNQIWINCRKTFKGGGGEGAIFHPKNYVADFSVLNEHFSLLAGAEKGQGSLLSEISLEILVSCDNCDP